MKRQLAASPGLLFLLMLVSAAQGDDVAFENVSEVAGINEVGRSWGAYWGDYNDDGFPDVWATNHGRPPALYLNNGDGTFTNVVRSVLSDKIWTRYAALDTHGASWADFDNDGYQDLFEAAAGGSRDDANNLFHNVSGVRFDEVAATRGVDVPHARPRTPLWLDWNKDGLLDLVVTTTGAGAAPVMLLEGSAGRFRDRSEAAGLVDTAFVEFALLADLAGEQLPQLCTAPLNRTLRVFSLGRRPMQELSESLGLRGFTQIVDVGSGDFDGDLDIELFMSQGEAKNGFDQPSENTLEVHLNPRASETGIAFAASGEVTFQVYPEWATGAAEIFIGGAGFHPDATAFTLLPDDPAVVGLAEHDAGIDTGFYVGFDPLSETWTAVYSNAGNVVRNLVISTPGTISSVSGVGFDPTAPPENNLLLDKQAGMFVDLAHEAGVGDPSSGSNVGAGDFDNDADLDIYVVATGPVTGKPNVLYSNNGDGTFTAVPGAGGAAGTLLGRGDAVSVVDFDRDGWLDLLVTNGRSKAPFDLDGPYELFRNSGGGNHWLEIDLEAVNSNRDAVGARVELTAGGVTQVREQNGGMHFRSQNHKRLHFGLGAANTVESIHVRWPDGRSQAVGPVPADQVIEIVEALPVSAVSEFSTPFRVRKGSVHVWKDALSGEYNFSIAGDGAESAYTVHLVAEAAPVKLAGDALESEDILVERPYGFSWSGEVTNGRDSVRLVLPKGAKAMFSLVRDGVSNPRQLHIGASGRSPSPAGWLAPVGQLDTRPDFSGGSDVGAFIGRGPGKAQVQVYWSAGSVPHTVQLEVLASHPLITVSPQQFEADDSLSASRNSLQAVSTVSGDWDGIDAVLPAGAVVAVSYRQDGLFQRHSVRTGAPGLGQPNAYWLPDTKAR